MSEEPYHLQILELMNADLRDLPLEATDESSSKQTFDIVTRRSGHILRAEQEVCLNRTSDIR